MHNIISSHPGPIPFRLPASPGKATSIIFLLLLISGFALGGSQSISDSDQNTLVIDSSPDMEIISFSKKVVVRQSAKGVLVFGNDVEIHGRVEGDVAAVGGSVIQKDGSFIGGDVIVFGGKYAPESDKALRGTNKQTIIYAAYEEEFQKYARDPFAILSPSFTFAFFALRVVLLLFWFLISLGLTTIAPGAISRAVARLKLSSTKIVAIGFFSFIGVNILLFAALNVLPNYMNAVFIGMALLTLALAYVLGRVALHVTIGKLIQKYFLSERNRSESLAVLLGVTAWTILLSLPYIWIFALLALISAGIGLVLTARPPGAWKTR
ncbi:MAG: hypothetical protein IT173_06670 [Acidobacteria bacterium]|nr:hypothetical protein [Acidobacteriota bacterium]